MHDTRYIILTALLCATLAATAAAEDWPQFRGPNRDGISTATGLANQWPEGGPRVLWSVEMAQGYSAAAIVDGRVYVNDYDTATSSWLVRCLNLADGTEIWRFAEKRRIRPNHGITRTVPAVDGTYVFSLDPKAVFHALDAKTGKEIWRQNLVEVYGTKIPPWYNGQCPLLADDRVVIATGGQALVVALEKATGKEIWRTPNPDGVLMSHVSLMPATLGGVEQYLYASLNGLFGIAAADGKPLWFHPRKFNVAVAPSPIAVDGERVFATGPYESGSIMIRVRNKDGVFETETVFDHDGSMWNSETHTPILYKDHMFAVGKKKRGLFTCLDLDGNEVWSSDGKAYFDLGSFLLADGKFFLLEGKTGVLRMLEASTAGYKELASAPVLSGHDVWGPMALSDGKLVIRDMTKMVCIDVAKP
jgi:outer membrane protein assembly factor BamB